MDNLPPVRPNGVVARPGRDAEVIELSWNVIYDEDLDGYRVYRNGAPVEDVSATTTEYTDTAVPQGSTYCYTVKAFDLSGNVSSESDPSCARPRNSNIREPFIQSAAFVIDDKGTTSLAGVPGSDQEDDRDYWSEEDDVVQVRVEWRFARSRSGAIPESYRVYRAELGSDEFELIGTVLNPEGAPRDPIVFYDVEPPGVEFVYEVASVVGEDESVFSDSPVDNTTTADELPPLPSVRNLVADDGRSLSFGTFNERSRAVIVQWSRVPDPRVIGYHVYRRCDWGQSELVWAGWKYQYKVQQTEFCADTWQRLTERPVTIERVYEDRTLGGLQGHFMYAVRSVTASLEEAPITKALRVSVPVPSAGVIYQQQADADDWTHDIATFVSYFANSEIPTQQELDRVNNTGRGAGMGDGVPFGPGYLEVQFHAMPQGLSDYDLGAGEPIQHAYVEGMRQTMYAELEWAYEDSAANSWYVRLIPGS